MTNREEVAKKLRKLFPLYRDKDIYQAVLERPPIDMMISERKQMINRLADLIDPTCKPVEAGNNIVCSECGADLYDDDLYCPHCGARVVQDNHD